MNENNAMWREYKRQQQEHARGIGDEHERRLLDLVARGVVRATAMPQAHGRLYRLRHPSDERAPSVDFWCDRGTVVKNGARIPGRGLRMALVALGIRDEG